MSTERVRVQFGQTNLLGTKEGFFILNRSGGIKNIMYSMLVANEDTNETLCIRKQKVVDQENGDRLVFIYKLSVYLGYLKTFEEIDEALSIIGGKGLLEIYKSYYHLYEGVELLLDLRERLITKDWKYPKNLPYQSIDKIETLDMKRYEQWFEDEKKINFFKKLTTYIEPKTDSDTQS